jgi:L-lactate dehydrogenase complex protein LldG
VGVSRDAILRAVRAARVPPEPAPSEEGPWSAPPDRAAAFARALEAAGGVCLRAAAGLPALEAALESIGAYRSATRVYSALPGLRRAGAWPAAAGDPRSLAGLEFAVLAGRFGVAESGAVFVDAGAPGDRAALWLAEHLALVLPAAELVDHLHAAYARLRFDGPGFGVFVAGPSKTADIEQALVVGAQGPRSTAVVLVGD